MIRDGKAHEIVAKVDLDGNGVYDEQTFVVQATSLPRTEIVGEVSLSRLPGTAR